jgi:hypothetical protein
MWAALTLFEKTLALACSERINLSCACTALIHKSTLMYSFKVVQYISMLHVNSYDTNFDAPDLHFESSNLVSDAQTEINGNPKCCGCKDL